MGLFGGIGKKPGLGDYIGAIASVLGDGYAAYRGKGGGYLDSFLGDRLAQQRRQMEQQMLLSRYRPRLQPAVLGPGAPRVPQSPPSQSRSQWAGFPGS